MTRTPLHDLLLPQLQAIVAEAVRAGFERQAVVAVLTDLVTDPDVIAVHDEGAS